MLDFCPGSRTLRRWYVNQSQKSSVLFSPPPSVLNGSKTAAIPSFLLFFRACHRHRRNEHSRCAPRHSQPCDACPGTNQTQCSTGHRQISAARPQEEQGRAGRQSLASRISRAAQPGCMTSLPAGVFSSVLSPSLACHRLNFTCALDVAPVRPISLPAQCAKPGHISHHINDRNATNSTTNV